MNRKYLVFNLNTKQYLCGWLNNWSDDIEKAEFYRTIEEAKRVVEIFADGSYYQIIEFYSYDD